MDPVSAIGLAGSVVGIVDVLAKSVNFLLNLQTKYKQADLTVSLLIGQLSTLKAALNQISEWITSRLDSIPQHEQLVSDLTISIQSCEFLVSALDDRINSFERNAAHTLNALGKAQLLWEESGTTAYINLLNNQINALTLLLTALQCRSLFEQRDLLQSDESRRVVNLIEDDMSSLLWLRDENSRHSIISLSTQNSEMFDATFDFDREVFDSKAYQVAFRSALSNKVDTRSKREIFPLRTLESTFDHVQLDGNEDTQTVSVRRDSIPPKDNEDVETIRGEQSGSLLSIDELPDSPLGELSQDVNGIIVPKMFDISTDPAHSSLNGNLPSNIDITHHPVENSANLVDRWLTPARNSAILSWLRDSRTSLTALDGEAFRTASTKRVPGRRFTFLPNRLGLRTSSHSAARERSCAIDEQLRMETSESRRDAKILVLGSSQSGKSVLLRSMQILHGINDYDHNFPETFKEAIFTNMVQGMKTVLDTMESSDASLEYKENEYHVQTIMEPAQIDSGPLDPNVALAISSLWNDTGVRECFNRSEKCNKLKSCKYYFDSISRIALPDYVPTNQDILRSYVKTTGITQTVFRFEGRNYKIFDVGGARSERKKWIHTVENVAVVLFLVDLSGYDEHLYEDPTVNRMSESVVLFDSICNARWFKSSSLVLLFTNMDCLQDKLATSPVKEYFPDFSGNQTSFQDVKNYFQQRFLSINQDPERKIDVNFTSLMSDTGPGRIAFATIAKGLRLRNEQDEKCSAN